MYWTDLNAGKIQRANLDGSNVEDLLIGLGNLGGIAIDTNEGKMYWANPGTGIQRANLDGSNVEVLPTGVTTPRGEIALTNEIDVLTLTSSVVNRRNNAKITWAFPKHYASEIANVSLLANNSKDSLSVRLNSYPITPTDGVYSFVDIRSTPSLSYQLVVTMKNGHSSKYLLRSGNTSSTIAKD
jgi:hypothetical protein